MIVSPKQDKNDGSLKVRSNFQRNKSLANYLLFTKTESVVSLENIKKVEKRRASAQQLS
jgi:hypothetical protein